MTGRSRRRTYRAADVGAPAGRERVGGYLSPAAADGWRQFIVRHGGDITALLEAVGLALAEGNADDRPLTAHVEAARRIKAERASRRPS